MKTQIKEKLFQIFMWFGFIGLIVLGIILTLSLNSCKAQESAHNTIKSDTILFDFSCVDDIVWSEDDGIYYIEYNDPDAFDYETLAYLTNRYSWYGEYIMIDIDESILPMFLNDQELYNQETDYCKKSDLNMLYTIVEHKITFPDSTIDYTWEIKLRSDVQEID